MPLPRSVWLLICWPTITSTGVPGATKARVELESRSLSFRNGIMYKSTEELRAVLEARRGEMEIKEPLSELRMGLQNLYGGRLKGIVLYGSWARGDAAEESDIDVMVILEGEVIPGREIDRMIDIISDINLKHSVLVAVYPVSEEAYEAVNSPLLMNARREGIPA